MNNAVTVMGQRNVLKVRSQLVSSRSNGISHSKNWRPNAKAIKMAPITIIKVKVMSIDNNR